MEQLDRTVAEWVKKIGKSRECADMNQKHGEGKPQNPVERIALPAKVSRKVGEEIQVIVQKIIEGYAPQRIILFGSYAHGEPNADSDLDLLIIKGTSERPMDRHLRVRRLVSTPGRRLPFDPLVLTPEEINERLDIGDQFVQDILAQGDVLYAS